MRGLPRPWNVLKAKMKRQTLNPTLWTISDGNAGNVRQAHALAGALGMQSRDWKLESRAPWRWTAPRGAGAERAFGPEFRGAMAQPPALAIGCGRQAALATRVLGRHGSATVQILDPRIATRHWDLVIAPEHDRLHGANVISVLGSLHPVDDQWLAEARLRFMALGTLPQPRTALLLGGASAHAQLDAQLLEALTLRVMARADTEGGCVLATTSRRSPVELAARLQRHFAGRSGMLWSTPGDGANPYPGLLACADRIVCTADSVNMLSEACATTVPVFVAGLNRLQGRPRRFVDRLLESGRVRALDDDLADFAVIPLRETARVAAQVRERLGL